MITGALKRVPFEAVAASAVPTPPAGCVTEFVDSADGQAKAKDSSGNVFRLGGYVPVTPNVIAFNTTIPAGYSAYVIQYKEVAAGVTLEVGAGAFFEVG